MMKLSELKPCAICHGPLLKPPCGNWYVIRACIAIVKPTAGNQVMGLAQMFGGNLGLAEVFAPDSNPVVITGDDEPTMMKEIHVCFDCWVNHFGQHFED